MRGGRRSRRGGRGEPRGRGARGARGRSGRALRRRRWMPCRAGSCRGAAISGRVGAKSERKLDWTRHPSFSSPKLLNSHTTTKLRLCANAAWSLIVTITSPDGPHARRLARTAGASPPTAAPPPGAVPSTPSPSRRRSHSSSSSLLKRETNRQTESESQHRRPSSPPIDPPSQGASAGQSVRRPSPYIHRPTSLIPHRTRIDHSCASITWRTCGSTPLPAPRTCWDPSCRFAQSPGRAGRRGWGR